jgi:hypothetical protein
MLRSKQKRRARESPTGLVTAAPDPTRVLAKCHATIAGSARPGGLTLKEVRAARLPAGRVVKSLTGKGLQSFAAPGQPEGKGDLG